MESASKRKRFYEEPVIVPQPKLLALRYEDASTYITPYVSWKFNFVEALQGYSKCKLMSINFMDHYYNTNRMTTIGVIVNEFQRQVRGGASYNNVGPTFCVPNMNWNKPRTYGWATPEFFTNEAWQPINIEGISTSSLTITLTAGVEPVPVTSNGVPPGNYWCDIILLLE